MILICLTMVIQGYTQGKDELIKWIDGKELGIEGRGSTLVLMAVVRWSLKLLNSSLNLTLQFTLLIVCPI